MGNEPRPRSAPSAYAPYGWQPCAGRKALHAPGMPLTIDLARLLEERESRRTFSVPLSDESLGAFLWFVCRNRSSRPSQFGFDQESRVHPSAGGMHPVHVLVGSEGGPWLRYDPIEHSLAEVSASAQSQEVTREQASALLDLGKSALLALLVEPGRTSAKYEHPESLVWRDAGVVLGYMSVVAEALQMPFCPLGLTGDSTVGRGWMPQGVLQVAGLALLGGPPTP